MSQPVGRFSEVARAVAAALDAVAQLAAAPSPRVAQHWEDATRLTWFGAAANHQALHASWSFGRLRGLPQGPGERHTVGVFHVRRATFPVIDEQVLRAALEALVPPGVDGPTRVFLQRVAAQLATADALQALARRWGVEVSLFARPDAVATPAPTPRRPEHARERVALALATMDPALQARCEATWAHPASALLEAARGD